MKTSATRSAKKILLRISIAFIMLFALFANTDTAKSQTYCNPYFYYPYYCYIYYLNFYNADRSINYWNYVYGYNYYPLDYTNTSFANAQWSGGDRFYFYIYVQGSFNYMFHTRIWVDWNNDGDWLDAGEQVYQPASYTPYNAYSITNSFQIPTTAPAGKHRMRVMVGYYYYMWYYANACCTGGSIYQYYRSAHDYTINIAPKNDAGISGIYRPADHFNSDDAQDVEVEIKNFSDLELHEADIYWSVDGVQQAGYHWTGTLAKDESERVTIATGVTFTPQAPWDPFHIEAWTDGNSLVGEDASANTMPDGNPNNDRTSADVPCILNDAGFVNADAMLPLYFGENDVILTVKNYAPKPLSRVTISWTIEGVPQGSYTATFNPPLNRGETADVTVGTYYFGSGIRPYLIEAETSNPNGVADEVPANDAGSSEVYKALEGGTYTIGPRESDYEDINSVMQFIGYWGLAGPVNFLIRQGTYYSSYTLAPKSGRQFPMTFESITRRALDVIIYNDQSENDYIFNIDGYNDLTFRNLTFEAPGVFFNYTNGGNNILFDHCVFNAQEGVTMLSPGGTNDIMSINGNLSGLEIGNCTFNGGATSIYAEQNGYNLSNFYIHDNEFNNASFGFIVFENNPADYMVIENNVFNGNNTPWGVGMWSSTNGMITNNRFNGIDATSNTYWGAGVLVGGGPNEVKDNTLTVSNAYGIYLEYMSNNATVKNNIISGMSSAYSSLDPFAGIFETYGSGNMITGNALNVSGMSGINVNYSSNSKVSYNKVVAEAQGVEDPIAGILYDEVDGFNTADNAVSTNGMYSLIIHSASGGQVYYNSLISNMETFYFDYEDGDSTLILMQQPILRGSTNPSDIVKDINGKQNQNKTLAAGPVSLLRNLFQTSGNNIVGMINDPDQNLTSNYNNWWGAGAQIMSYNDVDYDFAGYQTASGQDANSTNVEAMFMTPTDLRLTTVDANLYYTNQMLTGQNFTDYEENDLANEARTRAYYKGAYSMYPTIEIAQQPEDIIDCFGSTEHAFTVVANVNYNAELTYQWYKDGVAIFGETGPILYINDPLNYEMGAVYQCKVMGTGEADDVWSRPALLYTLRPTEITRQPNNVRVDLGMVATFEIDMHIYKEAPSMYQPDIQWYRGGVALQENDRIAGVNSSIMTIRDVQPTDLGDDYYVVISGMCGTDQSENITLSEIPDLTVSDLPATTEVCMGSDVSIEVTATSSIPGVTITYQWFKDGVALTDGAKFRGTTTETLMLFGAEANDAGDYTCAVTLESFAHKTTNASTLVILNAPVFTTDLPADVSVQTGKALNLAVAAAGANLTYQWYKDGTEITGATNPTFTIDTVTSGDEGTYQVKVANNCGEIMSTECVVTVTPFAIVGVDEENELGLNQNVPNPFSTVTRVGFVMTEAGQARLTITDASGKELMVIVDGTVSAGLNEYNVDARALNLSSGVYYYTLTVNGKSFTKSMVVVK